MKSIIPGRKKIDLFPYIIASPAVILLLLGMLYPILWSIWYSFTDKRIGTGASFVGLANYLYIFKDQLYRRSVINTLVFTAGAMGIKICLGFIVALILNMHIQFRNALRTLFLLPWTLPSVVAIYTWMWLYSGNGGLINNLLLQAGILENPIGWLSNPRLSIISLMLVNTWRGIPFIAISVLSGLQTIPTELYEAASIDGAGKIQSFVYITMPLITSVLLVSSLISTIWTLNDFETVQLLTGGGPGQSTFTVPITAFRYAFDASVGIIGRACAVALSTVPLLIVLMIPILNNMLGEDEKRIRMEEKRKRRLVRESV